jgi:hypothetical protein
MFASKNFLKHGDIEFNRMQELIQKDVLDLFLNMTLNFGIIRNAVVGFDRWGVSQLTNNTVKVTAGNAIILDVNGKPVAVKLVADYSLTIPSTDTIYKIAFKHQLHNYEDGTVSIIGGDTAIAGVGTVFTKIFAENRSIILGNGIYKIDHVTSDTIAVLQTPFPNASVSGVQFSVGGYFINTISAAADNLIYEHNGIQLSVKSGTLDADEYLLANVTVVGGIISSIADMRDLITLQMGLVAPASLDISHTFTITNEVKVASGDLYVIMPFAVSKPDGQTIKIKKCTYKILSGTSATVKLQKNGSDITGLTGLSVTQTKTTTTPSSDILLGDGDEIALVITAVTGTPKNLYFTLSLEYSI